MSVSPGQMVPKDAGLYVDISGHFHGVIGLQMSISYNFDNGLVRVKVMRNGSIPEVKADRAIKSGTHLNVLLASFLSEYCLVDVGVATGRDGVVRRRIENGRCTAGD